MVGEIPHPHVTLAEDSSCALMGPSGSGKSSLLNVLTGRALHYGASHWGVPGGSQVQGAKWVKAGPQNVGELSL